MYADVILPLAVEGCYTYAVPDGMLEDIAIGVRVVVPLGARKYYTGIVAGLHDRIPETKKIKPIVSVVDRNPIVLKKQIEFWQWIASYYMCSPGEVMKAAMPAALKAQGYSEDIREKYRAKTETIVSLTHDLEDETGLNAALDRLKRAKAQQQAILSLIEAGGSLPRNRLKNYAGAVKILETKGLVALSETEVSRTQSYAKELRELPQLTPAQQIALDEIETHFGKNPSASTHRSKCTLLHGVTGSGKTEIYIHLIAETIASGRDAIYLVPEIALTAQLVERLRCYFGDSVMVCHSRFGEARRAECYMRMLEPERQPAVVLGARSALLLPHPNLGLAIVDEEHENSYKQQDPAPRYHARDAAIMLAKLCGADVLLGSATPCIESYFNAATGKYGLVTLAERYGGVSMPRIVVSDIMRAARRGEKISHFTTMLLNMAEQAVSAKKQVILFQNRRGFSPYVECTECTSVESCTNCNVSLTYHKSTESLVCHYCGHAVQMPRNCASCGADALKPMGFGTEKVEEELQRLMPDAVIARLDTDSARSAARYSRIISEFGAGRIDILVGTQMVSKGFDFGNVSLVGVLNADNMLNFPDFRAAERSYQLMSQVSGRAGRRDTQGEVVIQTSQPSNPVILQITGSDYRAMFDTQIAQRKRFFYPPFCRIIKFTFKHPQKPELAKAGAEFERLMRPVFGSRLLGPEPPAVDKVHNKYLTGFMLKVERSKSFAQAKTLSAAIVKNVLKNSVGGLIISIDVDPQ